MVVSLTFSRKIAHTGLSGLAAAGMTTSVSVSPTSREMRAGFIGFQSPAGTAASARFLAR